MPFPIGAVIGAVAGIGSSIFGAASAKSQADAQYEAAEKQAKARFRRDMQEYRLANLASTTQYWWDVARTEQLRFNERQKASDYAGYQNAMIGAAANQLQARIQGLQMGYAAQMQGLGMRTAAQTAAVQGESAARVNEISTRLAIENEQEFARASIDYRYRTQATTLELMEAARQYLVQTNQQALEAARLTSRVNRESDEIVQTLALEEQRDYLGWQLNKISALLEDSKAGAQVTRQGGGKTSKLLMVQAAKNLGRSWGELEVKAKSRSMRLGLLNSAIKGEYANQLGQIAIGMQDMADRTAYAIKRGDSEMKMLNDTMTMLTIPGFAQRGRLAAAQINSVMASAAGQLGIIGANDAATRLTAGADLAASRLNAQADYFSSVTQLSKPYREEIYFDPLKPVKGLKPKYIGPTQPSTGNLGFTIANAIMGGVQGAMSFSYRNDAGQLSFY